jgi:hypothetical protein
LCTAGDENVARRSSDGRTFRRRERRDLEERLEQMEERVGRLERAAGGVRETNEEAIECTGCDELIGCLDDCVTDVQALRKRVKDARS